MGCPIGQTLGHTYGDAPAFSYPYLWSRGGKDVERDGRTVALDTKETVDSVKFMQGFWKDAHGEGGLDPPARWRRLRSPNRCRLHDLARPVTQAAGRKP